MTTNATNTAYTKTDDKRIRAGTVLWSRSAGDYDCVYEVEVLEVKGHFATVRAMGENKRCLIYADNGEDYIMAHGRHSMAPMFRASRVKTATN